MRDEFSVYWYDRTGHCHKELELVDAEKAILAVKRLTEGPATKFAVERVIITDGGDFCCYEWRDGRVTWDGREGMDDDETDH